jgi:hypothetical protein
MIDGYQVLGRRVRSELNELDRCANRVERAWQAAKRAAADQDMFIDSAALNLHGFYAGLERLFEAIALQLDGVVPQGETWHRDLLGQMTIDLSGVRPSVISLEVSHGLDEFRRFRHVVRNIYADRLDPERIGDLVAKLPPLWTQLKVELVQFTEFLEGVSRIDDSSH